MSCAPPSPFISKLIGICHRELDTLDIALEMFNRAMELGDKEKDTFLYLSEIHFFLNDMERAYEILEKMLLEYRDDIRPWWSSRTSATRWGMTTSRSWTRHSGWTPS
jgi:tetratricopeptide (TPR) repeat protein